MNEKKKKTDSWKFRDKKMHLNQKNQTQAIPLFLA